MDTDTAACCCSLKAMAIPADLVRHVADYFLNNPVIRINNVPSGGMNVPPVALCNIMAMDRRSLNNRHVATVAECCGLSYWKLRKSHVWLDRNSTNVMSTREGGLSFNGGQSGLHHALNAAQYALCASAVGSPFIVPTGIERRDVSASFFIPFYVDAAMIIANDTLVIPADEASGRGVMYMPLMNWDLSPRRFAGAIGLPAECKARHFNASVTIYESGEVLVTGKLTESEVLTVARMTIDVMRPCLTGVNLVKLRECIELQKAALLFRVPGPEGSAAEAAFEEEQAGGRMPRVFGPNRIALLSLNPELPENFMPVPNERSWAAVDAMLDKFKGVLPALCLADRAAARARTARRVAESGVLGWVHAGQKVRGIGRLRGKWRVCPVPKGGGGGGDGNRVSASKPSASARATKRQKTTGRLDHQPTLAPGPSIHAVAHRLGEMFHLGGSGACSSVGITGHSEAATSSGRPLTPIAESEPEVLTGTPVVDKRATQELQSPGVHCDTPARNNSLTGGGASLCWDDYCDESEVEW